MENDTLDLHKAHMLTVRELVEFLSTCNPDANVVTFGTDYATHILHLPHLPNQHICTVAEDKKNERTYANGWYAGVYGAEKKVEEHMEKLYRYVNDDDVIIRI